MTSVKNATLERIARNVLTRQAVPSDDAAAIAAATRRAHDELSRLLVPLIGQVGVDALTARALHLSQQERALTTGERPEQPIASFALAGSWLEGQEPALATDAAAIMLATFAALLATFIGSAMTMRLLRRAWPGGFSDTSPVGDLNK